MKPEALVFTRHEDSSITVDSGFPEVIGVSKAFLDQADPAFVSRQGNRIVFQVSNGSASYVVKSEHPWSPVLCCSRLW